MKKIQLFTIALCLFLTAFADVRPAKIFADSMVLQRGIAIPVWGWASKGEKITVQLNQQIQSVVTGPDGRWKMKLAPENAGGPYQLTIKGNNQVILHDVLVGDVWICSGQSNMEFTVNSAQNSDDEIKAASFPYIRHIKIANTVATKPKNDLEISNSWHSASAASVANFTAVGYFFARELYQNLQVPIGLINSSWGGTDVETWTSRQAMENSDEFREIIKKTPSVNTDSLASLKEKTVLLKIKKIQGALPATATVNLWKEKSYSDQAWPKLLLPGLWEQQSLGDIDGTVWFRKTILVTAADAGKSAQLSLSMIDDTDETYLNGKKVGSTDGYNIKRLYTIPAGILQAGENVLAIKVGDTGGGGGLYGDEKDLYLQIDQTKKSLKGEWLFQVAAINKGNGVGPNSYPSLLYNAMIAPLIPFGIKGAIWYQGESNAGRAFQYRKAFPLLIEDWRNQWKQGSFPFYFVQLASFNSANGTSEKGSAWAELREAQTLTLQLANTGMAVTTDIGDANNIHPKNKQEVGKRLAAVALHGAYAKQVMYAGPIFHAMKILGNQVTLSFHQIGSGLQSKGRLTGFEISGTDKKFYPAIAVIQGDQIILTTEKVRHPIAARYAWADDAGNANLFNQEGFPAQPFRTDHWKGITEMVKYRVGW